MMIHYYILRIRLEMCSRLIKSDFRQRMRETVELLKVPSIEPYRELVVQFLNQGIYD